MNVGIAKMVVMQGQVVVGRMLVVELIVVVVGGVACFFQLCSLGERVQQYFELPFQFVVLRSKLVHLLFCSFVQEVRGFKSACFALFVPFQERFLLTLSRGIRSLKVHALVIFQLKNLLELILVSGLQLNGLVDQKVQLELKHKQVQFLQLTS